MTRMGQMTPSKEDTIPTQNIRTTKIDLRINKGIYQFLAYFSPLKSFIFYCCSQFASNIYIAITEHKTPHPSNIERESINRGNFEYPSSILIKRSKKRDIDRTIRKPAESGNMTILYAFLITFYIVVCLQWALNLHRRSLVFMQLYVLIMIQIKIATKITRITIKFVQMKYWVIQTL